MEMNEKRVQCTGPIKDCVDPTIINPQKFLIFKFPLLR